MFAKAIKALYSDKIVWVRTSALLEILLYCLLFTLYDEAFGKGDRFFASAIHPFFFMVILVTVQYGTLEGIAATLIATLFLFSGDIPKESADEPLFEYQFKLSINPLIWFATAFVLGEMRTRIEHEKEGYKGQVAELTRERDVIASEYSGLKESKEELEAFVVSQQHSLANTYKELRSLETLRPALLLSNLEHIVLAALRIEKFSVYANGENGFEIVRSHNWRESDRFKQRITRGEKLYHEVAVEKKCLCIINEIDEKTLDNQGLLIAPLVNQQKNEVFGMLKVEKMRFMELNISTIETFKGVCEIIGMAYSNAIRHSELKKTSLYALEYPHLFSLNLYREQRELLKLLSKRSRFPLSEILLSFDGKYSWKSGKILTEKLSELIVKNLPATAQSFLGNRLTANIITLLPATAPEEASELARLLLLKAKNEKLLDDVKASIAVVDLHNESEIARYSSGEE